MTSLMEYEAAESRLFAHYGIRYRSSNVEISEPRMRLRVLQVGEGPPVLLVHGGGSVAAGWAPLMAAVHGVRLIAFDRPGCGLSDGFEYRGVDLRRHATDVLNSLLDALGLAGVPIVGTSMGGLWSLWLALDRPGRVTSLGLIACPALILGTSAPFPMRLLSVAGLNRLMLRMQRPSRAQARRLLARLGEGHLVGRIPDSFLEVFEKSEVLPVYERGWLGLVENALNLRGGNPKYVLDTADLARIAQPTVIIWGERDPFGNIQYARRVAGAIPNARLVEIPEGGHMPWLDRPETCAQAIMDIAGVGSPAGAGSLTVRRR